jgi:hypothetical protein
MLYVECVHFTYPNRKNGFPIYACPCAIPLYIYICIYRKQEGLPYCILLKIIMRETDTTTSIKPEAAIITIGHIASMIQDFLKPLV